MVWWVPLVVAAVSAAQKQQQTQAMNKANALKAQELSQGGGVGWQDQIAQALAKKKEDEWVGGAPQSGASAQGGFYGW